MTSQPDKLFREKLENFQRPASVVAWERIESGLNRNQSKGIWLKFAAGLSLFAVATYLLWPVDLTETQVSNATPVTPKTERAEAAVPNKNIRTGTKEENVIPKAIAKNKSVQKSEPILKTTLGEEKIANISEPEIKSQEAEVQVAVAETTVIEPSKTIVYTAEEVNAKFLKKKSPIEATASEKKTSGIQKLMGLAYTIKNPENGLGDLRQKKDEILALNFLSNEDKTNKEKN